jgi:hypothetical protein
VDDGFGAVVAFACASTCSCVSGRASGTVTLAVGCGDTVLGHVTTQEASGRTNTVDAPEDAGVCCVRRRLWDSASCSVTSVLQCYCFHLVR